MYKIFFIVLLFVAQRSWAQVDSSGAAVSGANVPVVPVVPVSVAIQKDTRIDLLVRKQIAINEETTRDSRRSIPGYRIQVINSHDRNKVFEAKGQIYQQFPDLKVYLMYQAPNYKLKVGNFKTQEEAEEFMKQLGSLFPAGVFVVRDTIDVAPNQ